jgi:hypothetical protein
MVCADPTAGKTAAEKYQTGFEGKGYPKPFICNSMRFEYAPGKGYQFKR